MVDTANATETGGEVAPNTEETPQTIEVSAASQADVAEPTPTPDQIDPLSATKQKVEEKSKTSGKKASKIGWKNVDVLVMFYLIVFITLGFMGAMFYGFTNRLFTLNIDLAKFASALNIAIIFITGNEGLRSFAASATQPVGESIPVPAYKLKYIMSYEISFILLTGAAIFCQMYCSSQSRDTNLVVPNFATDELTNGLLSNFIGYLIARFGNKVAENVDLSSIPFFKRQIPSGS
jgi:hypothetical protein